MPTFNHPTKQLGKRAPRLDKRTLKLADYTEKLAVPPIREGYIDKVATWPMYLNDKLGDCVIAAAAHQIQQWTTYAGNQIQITDEDVIKGYEKVGGYVPGDPDTDNGCDMLTALKYWRKTGFGGHKILAFVSVNPNNRAEIEQAIYLFGSVFAGFGLPLSAQNQTDCWSVQQRGVVGDGSVGSWGGHCVPLVGYSADANGQPGTMVISWGQPFAATWNFIAAYSDEMYAVLSLDWLNAAGNSPTGFNLTQLKADLAKL